MNTKPRRTSKGRRQRLAQVAFMAALSGLASVVDVAHAQSVETFQQPAQSRLHEVAGRSTPSGPCDPDQDLTDPKVHRSREWQASQICIKDVQGHTWPVSLRFDMKRTELSLRMQGKSFRLERHAANFSPALVGAEAENRFLPLNLQPYRSDGMWLYLSSVRTSGGDGGGMCGAGEEVFLNVLDLRGLAPRRLARHLIASCEQSIAVRTDRSLLAFDAFAVDRQGRLNIRFLAYGGFCSSDADKIGWLSDGFKQLHTRCEDAPAL